MSLGIIYGVVSVPMSDWVSLVVKSLPRSVRSRVRVSRRVGWEGFLSYVVRERDLDLSFIVTSKKIGGSYNFSLQKSDLYISVSIL